MDRTAGKSGFCKAGSKIEVYSADLHFGEEPPISGTNGSGAIFFNHCNLSCAYCQNYRFSQLKDGKEFEISSFVDLMLSLEKKGAHNINLVTPTHYAVQIANAVIEARRNGLKVPIVYNSSGYEKVDALKMLDGLVDIYLVDMRYADDGHAMKYSSCGNYVESNEQAVKEMYRQVGTLKLSGSGIAEKGIIIRHLILPNDISGSEKIFRFIANQVDTNTYISLMSQYYPANRASTHRELKRGINKSEYDNAVRLLYKYNLNQGWVQEFTGGFVDSGFAGTNIEPDL
ncbi:MAG: 4Fe-4S cluster-binding domain-containing protein [Candidatus Omnitrophica bacterium]|nr:4Fe-4S cluster-binding domain-containing protein [Candidatus Omnitrophota bacterium]